MPTETGLKLPKEVKEKEPTASGKWGVFEKAKLLPTEILCQAYKPYHAHDESCHTRVLLAGDQIVRHVQAEHGGGFKIKFKRTEGKAWPGWKALAESGLEIHDFRCEVCDNVVPLTVQNILNHLKPHKGKFRNAGALAGTLNFTFRFEAPVEAEETDEYELVS